MCTSFEGGGLTDGVTGPDEAERDTEQSENLDHGEADPHERLRDTGGLRLAGGRLDVRGEDQTHTDTGADGGKAVPDRGGATHNFGDDHLEFLLISRVT